MCVKAKDLVNILMFDSALHVYLINRHTQFAYLKSQRFQIVLETDGLLLCQSYSGVS